jgi:hypothetical protein
LGELKYVKGFDVKLEGKKLLGRHGLRWEHILKLDLQRIECEGADWINLAQYRDRWQVFL